MRKVHKPELFVFSELMKYKLSLAVTFSAGTGYFLFPDPGEGRLIPLLTGTFLLASGSAVLNQYTEREQDSLMERTSGRPIPSQRVSLPAVKRLLLILMLTGCSLLLLNGVIPAALGILNVILYNMAYTRLKKITSLAIIPGAMVGAIPPLIGFTSAGGTVLNQKILLFSAFMFLWQIPHFWLLLVRYGKEYRKAGFVTISDFLSEKQIKILVFLWIVLTSILLAAYTAFTGVFSRSFASAILILNPLFIILFSGNLFAPGNLYGLRGAFIILNTFGILVMFLMIADSLFWAT